VLGTGSVGRRHLRNLADLGCQLSGMDPDRDRLVEASKEVVLNFQFTSIDKIENYWGEFDGVVVCSPTKFHQEQSVAAAQNGIPVLLEKPLTRNLQEGLELRNALTTLNAKILLGYTYRWWPPLLEFKKQLKSGKIGKPLHAKFIMSAHLADWHPWERYQDFFMASKELGGGALLDESHFVDLMIWMFGMPEELYANVDKLSDLEIETDDNVDILIKYKDSLRVMIHLDLFGRPHEKYISVTGDQGTLEWSFDPNNIRESNTVEQKWKEQVFDLERNEMFISVAKEFLDIINGKNNYSCTIDDGVQVMQVLEACRISSEMCRTVKLEQLNAA